MADRGTATFIPTSPARVASNYDPITRGTEGGGGEPFTSKQHIRIAGEWVRVS